MKKDFLIKNDADYDKIVMEICNRLAKVCSSNSASEIALELLCVRYLLNSIWYYKIYEVR